MSSREFKVGDVVYVSGRGGLSGPTTITKQHARNGNLYVNGLQYSKFGMSRGDAWSFLQLLHDGSPELAAEQRKQRRKQLEVNILDISQRARCGISPLANLDEVEAAAKALRAALKI